MRMVAFSCDFLPRCCPSTPTNSCCSAAPPPRRVQQRQTPRGYDRERGLNSSSRGVDDALVNCALALLASAGALAGVLRLAGSLAAWLTATPPPGADVEAGIRVLADPAHPGRALGAAGLNPIGYWEVLTLLITVGFALAWGGWKLLGKA
jgi:hypothetical protein